jgi:spore coat protein CotH
VFDQSVVHTIDIEVGASDLPRLVPGNDERVPARFTFDGTTVEDVGLRLKSGEGSRRSLDGKAGFSIDTDEFVSKRSLFGVTRFTLGNSVGDSSFIVESIAYEVFRNAGVVAPRTAFASVTFNGELFGLYVLREGYDKNFLRRTFADPDGNLYEGSLGVDVSDAAHMEARTNEAKGDKSDLEAVATIVADAPDDAYLAAIGEYVDLDQLLTYWAVEALVHHWDGYVRPNNYYVYHDPARGKFVFLAHGADWAMLDPSYSVLAEPGASARMALRLYENPEFLQRLRSRLLEVLDQYWNTDALLARADQLASLVRTTGLSGSREEVGLETFESALADRRTFIATRAAEVRAQLDAR